jgi:hypothetical protein
MSKITTERKSMATRRFNEALIGMITLGKAAELGRQLTLVANDKFAGQTAGRVGANRETLQKWGNGYVGFDAVISTTGVLAILQGIRKNRKGAGQAALIQGGTLMAYSVYYFLYSFLAMKGAKTPVKLLNAGLSMAHGAAGFAIWRFAQRALK